MIKVVWTVEPEPTPDYALVVWEVQRCVGTRSRVLNWGDSYVTASRLCTALTKLVPQAAAALESARWSAAAGEGWEP